MKLRALGHGMVAPAAGLGYRNALEAARGARAIPMRQAPGPYRRVLPPRRPPSCRRVLVVYRDGAAALLLVHQTAPAIRLSGADLAEFYFDIARRWHGVEHNAGGSA